MTAPSVEIDGSREEERSSVGRERVVAWIAYAVTAAAAIYLVIGAFDPVRWNWGDPWSDGNVQSSGKFFAREGFVASRFTPILDVDPLPAKPLRYTHYPPLPDLVNGVEQKLLGARDIAVYRLIALAMSFAAVALFGATVRRLWGRRTALLAVPLFATNIVFLEYADTIHHVPLYLFTGFGAIYAGVAWMQERRRALLAWCGVGIYFCLLASYDFYFFLPLMLTIAFIVLRARLRDVRPLVAVAFAAAVASVATKLALSAWAVGVKALLGDLVFQFFERATTRHAEDYRDGFLPILVGRTWRFFGPVFYVGLFAGLASVADRLRGRAQSVPASPLLVLAAGVPFLVVFEQLFCGQYHPTIILLPGFAITSAVALAAMLQSERRVWHALAGALFATTMIWQVVELARLEKAFLRRDDVGGVRRALDETDHRRFVLTNAPADGPVRYYWDRHVLPIPTRQTNVRLRNMFDTYGADGPLTVVEFRNMERIAYDKLLYPYFAPERQWGWIANPFAHRHEWRPRVDKIQQWIDDAVGGLGTVVYESPDVVVRSITRADVDKHQRALLPEGETRFIDFETYTAQLYEVDGFAEPEQYELHHGFAWLQQRTPSNLVFTLKGLVDDPVGPPIRRSTLRVRLAPGHDYRFVALGYTSRTSQHLTMFVNDVRADAIVADTPDENPRLYELHIPASLLRDDGVQTIAFAYDSVDKFGNGLLFHWARLDRVAP